MSSLVFAILKFGLFFSWCLGVTAITEVNQTRGAIICLTKFWRTDRLITRNQHIEKNIYDQSKMDIILFHQKDLDESTIKKIRAGTPNMPLKFVDVDIFFRRNQKAALTVDNNLCPRNKAATLTPPGYKTMCAFFSYGFRHYFPKGKYSWLLRVDDDCYLKSSVKKRFPPLDPNIHIMSANWIVDAGGPDSGRDESPDGNSGVLVRGLRRYTYEYAHNHNVSHDNPLLFPWHSAKDAYVLHLSGNTSKNNYYSIYDMPDNHIPWKEIQKYKHRTVWPAPATNTFYINLTWLYEQPLLLSFLDGVEKSKCIFSNRWGDLPIWGAALALMNEQPYRWDVNVEHSSHRCMYTSRKKPPAAGSGRPCNDAHVSYIKDYY